MFYVYSVASRSWTCLVGNLFIPLAFPSCCDLLFCAWFLRTMCTCCLDFRGSDTSRLVSTCCIHGQWTLGLCRVYVEKWLSYWQLCVFVMLQIALVVMCYYVCCCSCRRRGVECCFIDGLLSFTCRREGCRVCYCKRFMFLLVARHA